MSWLRSTWLLAACALLGLVVVAAVQSRQAGLAVAEVELAADLVQAGHTPARVAVVLQQALQGMPWQPPTTPGGTSQPPRPVVQTYVEPLLRLGGRPLQVTVQGQHIVVDDWLQTLVWHMPFGKRQTRVSLRAMTDPDTPGDIRLQVVVDRSDAGRTVLALEGRRRDLADPGSPMLASLALQLHDLVDPSTGLVHRLLHHMQTCMTCAPQDFIAQFQARARTLPLIESVAWLALLPLLPTDAPQDRDETLRAAAQIERGLRQLYGDAPDFALLQAMDPQAQADCGALARRGALRLAALGGMSEIEPEVLLRGVHLVCEARRGGNTMPARLLQVLRAPPLRSFTPAQSALDYAALAVAAGTWGGDGAGGAEALARHLLARHGSGFVADLAQAVLQRQTADGARAAQAVLQRPRPPHCADGALTPTCYATSPMHKVLVSMLAAGMLLDSNDGALPVQQALDLALHLDALSSLHGDENVPTGLWAPSTTIARLYTQAGRLADALVWTRKAHADLPVPALDAAHWRTAPPQRSADEDAALSLRLAMVRLHERLGDLEAARALLQIPDGGDTALQAEQLWQLARQCSVRDLQLWMQDHPRWRDEHGHDVALLARVDLALGPTAGAAQALQLATRAVQALEGIDPALSMRGAEPHARARVSGVLALARWQLGDLAGAAQALRQATAAEPGPGEWASALALLEQDPSATAPLCSPSPAAAPGGRLRF